jgi:hypothetical protein
VRNSGRFFSYSFQTDSATPSVAATAYVVLLTLWLLLYVYMIAHTFRQLRHSRYVKTRFRHLSFRLFVLLSFIVVIYVAVNRVVRYIFACSILDFDPLSTSLLFFTYLQLTAFVYAPIDGAANEAPHPRLRADSSRDLNDALLPSDPRAESHQLFALLSNFFTEREVEVAPLLSGLPPPPTVSFCFELGLLAVQMSNEVYFSPPGRSTRAIGRDRLINVDPMGVTLERFLPDGPAAEGAPAQAQNYAFVATCTRLKCVVVSFRGTVTRNDWVTDLSVRQCSFIPPPFSRISLTEITYLMRHPCGMCPPL